MSAVIVNDDVDKGGLIEVNIASMPSKESQIMHDSQTVPSPLGISTTTIPITTVPSPLDISTTTIPILSAAPPSSHYLLRLAHVVNIFTAPARLTAFLRLRLTSPPDGGFYGWITIWASFLVFFLVIGLEAVWGLLAENMLNDEALGASRSELALAQGFAMFVELALGTPVAHACDRFGVRSVVAVGGVTLGLGLLCAAFTPNGTPSLLYLSYSIVAGSGMALSYGAACIGLGAAFKTKATLANAVAGLGIGFGTLALAKMIGELLIIGGWRHSFIVLAILQGVGLVVAAICFVPIDMHSSHLLSDVATATTVTAANATTNEVAMSTPSPIILSASSSSTNTATATATGTPPHTALSVLSSHPPPKTLSLSFVRRSGDSGDGGGEGDKSSFTFAKKVTENDTFDDSDNNDALTPLAIATKTSPQQATTIIPTPRFSHHSVRGGGGGGSGIGTPQSPFLLADGHSAGGGSIMPSLSLRRDVVEAAAMRRRGATLGTTPRFGPTGQVPRSVRSRLTTPALGPTAASSTMTPSLTPSLTSSSANDSLDSRSTAALTTGIDESHTCGECGSAWPEPAPEAIVETHPAHPLPAFLARLVRFLPRRGEGPDAADASVVAATSLWRDTKFLSIATCFALVVSTISVSESHLGTALVEAGHSPTGAANVYATMGAVGIVFRLFIGYVTLYYEVDVGALIMISAVSCGVAIMGLSAHSHDATYVYLYAGVIGALGGLVYSMLTPLLLEVFGFDRLTVAIGASLTFRAPAVLAAAPLAGLLRDSTGSYSVVWTLTGLLCTLSALPLSALSFKCTKRKSVSHHM